MAEDVVVSESVRRSTSINAPLLAALAAPPGFGRGRTSVGEGAQPELADVVQADGLVEPRSRLAGQAVCSTLLLLSCMAATAFILSEAVQGVFRSVYCRIGHHRMAAPVVCVVPLSMAAVVCHFAVVSGLLCVARFAWRSRSWGVGAGLESDVGLHRIALRSDLKVWRNFSGKVLFASGATYLLAGAPCAGLARLAFVFLATGFLTLYATVIFFDDDFENAHARLSPRLFRYLGVYALVGLTFTALSSGMVEWLGGRTPLNWMAMRNASNAHDTASSHVFSIPPSGEACSATGREHLSPPSCTVPLDLAAVMSMWWAASPLFSMLIPSPRSTGPGEGGTLLRSLQRWRHRVDAVIVSLTVALLVVLQSPCQHDAPVAFGNAQLGVWIVVFLVLLRRASPQFDGWRGPLEHLAAPPSGATCAQQCAVCLMELNRRDDVCRTPCGHDFHRDCLEDWSFARRYRSPDCPLCRETIDGVENPLTGNPGSLHSRQPLL